MCGIAGLLDPLAGTHAAELTAVVTAMTESIRHRGPDDSGVWVQPQLGLALGHRRLSILDLSPQGHQPMQSACGRYIIAFNGEIYNHAAIRRDLENEGVAPPWRGHSDTEVMLAAVVGWGVEAALKRFNGMFAFALWDGREQVLYLARDRMGEKPLYYSWLNGVFVFASELKALRTYSGWRGAIDRKALALFLRHNHVPTPYSIYEGVQKLPAASWLSLPWSRARARQVEIKPYWSVRAVAESGIASPLATDDAGAVNEAERLLREAVKLRMEADVPLGAFLSGGIDSSTVIALMQAQSDRPVKTFSIGFHDRAYNEAQQAEAVARHLGTDHTELYVTPAETMAVIPRLPELYDEPFSDSSQIPTFLVSELARRHVTVSLSGDGGDELFAGYNRYFWGRNIWRTIGWMPNWLRALAASVCELASQDRFRALVDGVGRRVPAAMAVRNPIDKLQKLAEVLTAGSPDEMYYRLVSHWKDPSAVVRESHEPPTVLTESRAPDGMDFTQRMMYLDMLTYLPDDILVKVDRAAMGVSLETRVPLLDHRVVEFAWQLPLSMKIRGGQGKWLLRQVLYRHVPRQLVERPKMGFSVPIDDWLRGPLRDWAESLLDEQRLRVEGFFNPKPIREKWSEHVSGHRNWQYYLWDILMFQAWHERWEQRAG
ncbi:MAG: asparagine synthase [Thiotrichales bacterium SG8_50]|nr:MAG: asparagine synthase [Thiotrichales bacterium SG8_50]